MIYPFTRFRRFYTSLELPPKNILPLRTGSIRKKVDESTNPNGQHRISWSCAMYRCLFAPNCSRLDAYRPDAVYVRLRFSNRPYAITCRTCRKIRGLNHKSLLTNNRVFHRSASFLWDRKNLYASTILRWALQPRMSPDMSDATGYLEVLRCTCICSPLTLQELI